MTYHPFMRNKRIALSLLILVQPLIAHTQSLDLSHATIRISPAATDTERAAINLLQQEAAARTRITWPITGASQKNSFTIVIARADQIAKLYPHWQPIAPAFRNRAEGYTLRTYPAQHTIIIAGNDSRGILYGVGHLLRKLSLSQGSATLATPINTSAAPQYPIRSHQIGYRYKNNTYDAWDLALFSQHIRDLAVFGISGLQLIAPHSDDRPESPLYPAPALPTLIGISRELAKYGLDCDIYYPELRNYEKPENVTAELADFEAFVRVMPRINALYIPGGDPGHTAPHTLFPLVEKEAAILHRYQPNAAIWISAQGFDAAWFAEFYSILKTQHPAWLTGVFFGPQSRDGFPIERAQIPAQYKMLFYPDIGHTMHAQFPVPQWDPVFAMTEGREPIDPRPQDFTHIYRTFAKLNTGFVTYSEGVNDDVNKFLFTRLGWSSTTDPNETLRDYARYFVGPRIGNQTSDDLAAAINDLEQNWRGPIAESKSIPATLKTLQAMESSATPEQQNNWRFESLLYRAYYDAYLQKRFVYEALQQLIAISPLASLTNVIDASTVNNAVHQLQSPLPQEVLDLRAHVFALADRLNKHVHIQLSVEKYGASGIERGANLDHIDLPLNDKVWFLDRFKEISALPTEKERQAAIYKIAHWQDPVPDTLYDDLGDPGNEPHLLRGEGYATDPEMYHSAIDGIADKTTADGWRVSQLTYAETLYETPLTLQYKNLDPQKHYTLRVTYAGEDYTLPLTLTANGITIHAARKRKSNPETVDFQLPAEATHSGTLRLEWQRPPNLGGSGRGRQVAEIWLIPNWTSTPAAPNVAP